MAGVVNFYYYLNEEIADHRTENWPLMRTPWPGILILSLYLMIVLKWLPYYMKDRPPYDPRKFIVVYNAAQVACCTYVLYQSLKLGWLNHYQFICHPVDDGPLAMEFAWKVCYFYFVLKLTDLLDTIFFVLRKKQNQVTVLHLYHHFGMVVIGWSQVKWVPGGHTSFVVVVNSFVHIVMYSYYLLAIWDEKYKKSLWWKKHVTQLQLVQFTLLLFHFLALALAPECSFPREPAYIVTPLLLLLVSLFANFYNKTYMKPQKLKPN